MYRVWYVCNWRHKQIEIYDHLFLTILFTQFPLLLNFLFILYLFIFLTNAYVYKLLNTYRRP